jgi:hypothetical protein
MKKMGRAGKCWDEAKKDFKLPKYESMPGYANGLPWLTLINETLSRTVTPVKQFLGLLV